jgi:hypothetical protein
MGARGCALDNAVCEAFFASLKKEKLNRRSWPARRDARNAVFASIEGWDNRRRLHSTLGYLAPADYENRTLEQDGAGLAASRLAHSPIMIKEKAAQTSRNVSAEPGQVHVLKRACGKLQRRSQPGESDHLASTPCSGDPTAGGSVGILAALSLTLVHMVLVATALARPAFTRGRLGQA